MSGSRDLFVGLRLRDTACGLREGANKSAARQTDLEGVASKTLGLAKQNIGGLSERGFARRFSAQRRFRFGIPPGLLSNAAERKARFADLVSLQLEADCDRNQRKSIGQPVADFQIGVVRG